MIGFGFFFLIIKKNIEKSMNTAEQAASNSNFTISLLGPTNVSSAKYHREYVVGVSRYCQMGCLRATFYVRTNQNLSINFVVWVLF
jgi:hypothetical protein